MNKTKVFTKGINLKLLITLAIGAILIAHLCHGMEFPAEYGITSLFPELGALLAPLPQSSAGLDPAKASRKRKDKPQPQLAATQNSEKRFACDQCEYSAQYRCLLKRHMPVHTGQKSLACDQCDYKCTRPGDLKKHTRTHTGETPFACDQCSYKGSQRGNLERHKQTHTREKSFICEHCGLSFIFSYKLRRHLRTHIPKTLMELPEDDELSAAIQTLIDLKPPTESQPEMSAKKKRFKFHFDRRVKVDPRLFEKPEATTPTPNEKPFLFFCEHCSYLSIDPIDFETHSRIHTSKRPFVCEQCGERFAQNKTLKRHQLTHTGEKTFACDQCDYKTRYSWVLKRHTLTHTGEKPFACDRCNYRCTTNGNLKTHMQTHTSEKSFACTQCNSSYVLSSNLKRHIAREHNE